MFPPSVTLPRERYEQLLVQLELDLRGFLARAHAWLGSHVDANRADVLLTRLANAMAC